MSALSLLSSMREHATTDGESNAAIVSALARLPKAPDDMLRLFDRGSYYSLHGRDAHTVAAGYFKSSSCVRYAGEERQPYLSFNKTMGAEVAARLEPPPQH